MNRIFVCATILHFAGAAGHNNNRQRVSNVRNECRLQLIIVDMNNSVVIVVKYKGVRTRSEYFMDTNIIFMVTYVWTYPDF